MKLVLNLSVLAIMLAQPTMGRPGYLSNTAHSQYASTGETLFNPLAQAGGGDTPGLARGMHATGPGCAVPPPVVELQALRHTIDNTSAADEAVQRQASSIVARPLYALASAVNAQTNLFLASGRRNTAAAQCAMDILDAWARANALSGDFNDPGLAIRRWVVNAVAIDFLAVEAAPGIDPAQRTRVATWLDGQGQAIIATLGDYQNNHRNWAAAAVAATAIASNDRQMFGWAVDRAREGLMEVAPDGTLPLEMRRQKLAMNYNVFALEPLVQVAGLAKANGIDLYGVNQGALGRLVRMVVDNIGNPQQIQRMTGLQQNFPGATPDTLSWAEQYFADTGDCTVAPLLRANRPVSKGYLGGNTTLLYGKSLVGCKG